MATKKNDDLFESLSKKGEQKIRRKAKSKVKRIHTATKVLAVLFLVIGIGVGGAVCFLLSKNDRFELKGDTSFSISVGDSYTYEEQGVEAVCFGRDVSGKLQVETELTQDENGNYIIPTDKEGVYTITYTVDAWKFQKGENGVIKRIRTFTVNAAEEDGRNG